MRMILTVAMALSLVGSVSGQAMPLVTIDKTNLAPPPPNAPPGTLDTVQPEGKAFVGQVPDTWGVYVMFGTNTTANGFTAFANTTANVFPIQQPTPPNGQAWKFPGPLAASANWTSPYYCRAELIKTTTNQFGVKISTVTSTALLLVK